MICIQVGVVGRTGSGKSSLLAALLRLNEIVDGDILIDGVSLVKLGLDHCRSAISWIPQDPHIFSGSLRFNLDPFDQYSDQELWSALNSVKLDGVFPNLMVPLSEGGANLSVGQRQLLSLARASLRNNRVLLLDEATANVDLQTDSFIQQTLRTSPAFRDRTIIVIAHRIQTVMDADMVVVLADGKVKEIGNPKELQSRHDSAFGAMVRQEGSRGVNNK